MPVVAPNLIVEDGTGVAGANSYASDDFALTYFNDRGDSKYPSTDKPTRTAALVRAAFGMDFWLNGRWRGRKKTATQVRDWPRCGVRDSDGYVLPDTGVPVRVQQAQCEIAKIELTTPFIQQRVNRNDAAQMVRVGPIETSFKATAPSITYWPQIIAMLRDFATIGIMPIEVVIGLSEREMRLLNSDQHGYGMNPFDFPDYFHLVKDPLYNPGYDAPWLI